MPRVCEGDRDRDRAVVPRQRGRAVDDRREAVRQEVSSPDDAEMDRDPRPPPSFGDRRDGVGGDLGDGPDLVGGTLEILDREGPQGDLVDAELGAPVDELERLLGPAAMTDPGCKSLGGGPTAVAVHDHGDVTWSGPGQDGRLQPALVERVDRSEAQVAGPPVASTESESRS
jgi:hypothetical protein